MRAARLHAPGTICLHAEDEPVAAPGEEIVRVTAVGLCGSDLHWYREGSIGDATLAAPLVLGHEMAGVIEGGPRHGMRVAVDPAVPCGRCDVCASGWRNLCPTVRFAGHGSVDGGLRELISWPSQLLHPLPREVDGVLGALLEPLGVALHAVDLAHIRLGATVAVVGCGPIGLCVAAAARLAGASQVIAVEPLAHRRHAAMTFGADAAIDPADAMGDEVADVAIDAAGTQAAVDLAVRLVRPGGRVVLAGIPDEDRTTFHASTARRKGLTLALVRRMNEAYPRAIRLARTGRIPLDALTSHRFVLAQTGAAFRVAAARSGLKVVVEPQR